MISVPAVQPTVNAGLDEPAFGPCLSDDRCLQPRNRHYRAPVRGETRLREIADDDSEPKVVRSTAARSIEEDPGAFRRQFTGGTEGATGGDPTKNRLNKKPDF